MNSKEIEENLRQLTTKDFDDNFIFDFLLSYGLPKASITLLRKGARNKSDVDGEILYKGKIFFRVTSSDRLLHDVELYSKDERILKQTPRFVLLTDRKSFAARDLKLKYNKEFSYQELPQHFEFFLPLIGGERYRRISNNEADRNAAYELAKLYEILIADNPKYQKGLSHQLNVFLARLLFCFYAEDTGIFKEDFFTNAIFLHTADDGSNVHTLLEDIFRKLNSGVEHIHPVYVQHFPYVNGGLFRDEYPVPIFSKKSRDILLNCSQLNWQEINPDIFGSMIQAVADPEERSNLGMHYTSVENILKVIRPLFLDELYEEFEKHKDNERELRKLRNRMEKMKFFDPACGSGNFLIIAYKELRILEVKIIHQLIELQEQKGLQEFFFTQISLDQLYGIEIKGFAHEIAMVSLWLAEHQMNLHFEAELLELGRVEPIIPLKEAGHIVCANAATISWDEVCPRNKDDEIYLIGNPPYIGSRIQEKAQKDDMEYVFRDNYKSMDYISIWFYKGSKYIEGYNASLAFVSTNSICQGLLVGLSWPRILNENIEIGFAHTSFKWTNNAIGNAGVTVVIVGLRNTSGKEKYIFTNNFRKKAKNINAYLQDNKDIIINSRSKPLSQFPKMYFGNMPADGGYLLFSEDEYKKFLLEEPNSKPWFKQLISAQEFLNGQSKYCLWLEGITKEELNQLPLVKDRVRSVEKVRLESSRPHLAKAPHLFVVPFQTIDKAIQMIMDGTIINYELDVDSMELIRKE